MEKSSKEIEGQCEHKTKNIPGIYKWTPTVSNTIEFEGGHHN